jgi:hypothetical protein
MSDSVLSFLTPVKSGGADADETVVAAQKKAKVTESISSRIHAFNDVLKFAQDSDRKTKITTKMDALIDQMLEI